MLQEFKDFAMKGNIVDLAVAVVIGAAFGKIVSSLVENIITPVVGMIMGGVSFADLAVMVGDAELKYGAFLQSIMDFVIVAFVLFMVIKAMNKAQSMTAEEEEEEEAGPKPPTQEELLTEIRDLMKK